MVQAAQSWWIDSALPAAYSAGSGRNMLGLDEVERKNLSEFSHAHADYRIKNHQNEYDRVDAILALKRSMQSRVDHLDSLYGFKQYPEFKDLGPLGLLEHWGVIRRRMLHRMRQLRNAVEHDGAVPPSLDDCEDYAEVTWWFLRGTSPLLMPLTNIDYDGAFHGSVQYEYKPFRISIYGDIDASLLSDSSKPGWVKLKTGPLERGPEKGKITPLEIEGGQFRVEASVASPEWGHEFMRAAFRELL